MAINRRDLRNRSIAGHSVRIFENGFLEWFTHIRVGVVLGFWLSVSLGFLATGLSLAHLGLLQVAAIFGAAVFIWTLFEYFIHRVLFHWIAVLPGGKRMAFVLHGCHHVDPSDASRNVMPLVVSIPVFAGFFMLFLQVFDLPVCLVLFGFFGLAYLSYDLTHYACHQLAMSGPIGRYLKSHHAVHHYRDSATNFSITCPLWDRVFGTLYDA